MKLGFYECVKIEEDFSRQSQDMEYMRWGLERLCNLMPDNYNLRHIKREMSRLESLLNTEHKEFTDKMTRAKIYNTKETD